jgi:threonine/homoserine/homoserine lactone efflux protein
LGTLTANLIPLAIGIAISPVPVIAVIMMLSSGKALKNSLLFDLGWLVAITALGVIGVLALGGKNVAGHKGAGPASDIADVVLGVLLLFLAARRWMRGRGGAEEKEPRLLKSIDSLRPLTAFGFGAALILVNPKNLMIALAGIAQILKADPGTGASFAALAVFIVVATIGVALPVVVYALMPSRAASILGSWKTWLAEHNSAVMMYLLLVLGIFLLAKGIVGLV